MGQRHYEEFEVGDSFDLGSRTITEAEIVAFAEEFDPQPFHVDPEAAAETQYGQLFASGWHTAAVCMRLLVDGLLAETAVVSGVGVDDLRWKRPVFGGDELAGTASIVGKEPWDGDAGTVRIDVSASDRDGEAKIRFVDIALVSRRNGE
jgi:acyl dehydratase